jgi:hypothetical protein
MGKNGTNVDEFSLVVLDDSLALAAELHRKLTFLFEPV